MRNIIKAQIYQIKQDKLLWILFIGMILLNIREIVSHVFYQPDNLSGSYFCANLSNFGMYSTVFILLTAVYLMGRDYMDQTINLEIAYGYSRGAVFWGRVFSTLFVTALTTMLLLCVIPVCSTVWFGWGTEIAVSEFLFRVLVYFFLVIRVTCEMILLTVVFREPYKAYIISFVVYVVSGFLETKNGYVFAASAGAEIFDFEGWIVYHLDGTGDILYEKVLSGSTAWLFILTSIGIGAACLSLAAHFFRINDLD